MSCNCGKNRRTYTRDPMGGYKYLRPHQIKARLEIFKKNNCKDCKDRYVCDYSMYLKCKSKLT